MSRIKLGIHFYLISSPYHIDTLYLNRKHGIDNFLVIQVYLPIPSLSKTKTNFRFKNRSQQSAILCLPTTLHDKVKHYFSRNNENAHKPHKILY